MAGKAGRRPASVLLVDDEDAFRETLGKVLRRRGMAVETAGCGREALERLAASPAEVVVLDLKMPGADGLSVLGEIRRRWPGVRVVILTGHGSPEAGLGAIRGEAFDFLLKPVVAERLVEVIEAAAADARGPAGG